MRTKGSLLARLVCRVHLRRSVFRLVIIYIILRTPQLVCFCGRTVYELPIPCGTSLECHCPCPCPLRYASIPLPFILATSIPPLALRVHPWPLNCVCAERKSCRIPAALRRRRRSPAVPFVESTYPLGPYFYLLSTKNYVFRPMACRLHHCQRLYPGTSAGCTALCGRLCTYFTSSFDPTIALTLTKIFLPNRHPCMRPCHAPSSCPETESCHSLVTLTCQCGRIRQSVPWGRTASSSRSARSPPKCNVDSACEKECPASGSVE